MLTIEWQPLSTRHGYTMPVEIDEAGLEPDWRHVMDDTRSAVRRARRRGSRRRSPPYVVPMAYRVRYCLQMNAREAMHVIELRTAPQGHPSYRRVCQQMHRLIAESRRAHGHRGRRCGSRITARSSSSGSARSGR